MTTFVLVLIGGAGEIETLAEAVGVVLARTGAADVVWLSRGEACEIPLHVSDMAAARAVLDPIAARLSALPVDVCVVPAEGRRKGLLIADMDSTIIQQECIDEMADMLGLKPRIAAITERAMRGELPFEAALIERLALLAGLAESDLQRVFDQRITLMPGARTLVATMRAAGAFTALVSGGFGFFTSRVAAAVGFDVNRANTLEVVGGRLTGRVVGPILGREAKLAALEQYRSERGLAATATMAVGDGANDLAMIKAAGLGVAYRAKPVVAAEADAGITHGDLTALLFLQGYARSEFVDRG
ncbi:MAG: phosphoserine phosphatase SerB [Hyphomicrobiaceae bacterium]